jgi:hypothetical protein
VTRRSFLPCLWTAVAFLLTLASAASAAGISPIPEPGSNRTLNSATTHACYASATDASCINGALADVNAARASEGVVPMVLPADFDSLTIPQQLLVLSNLERVDRGLIPVSALSSNLDGYAATGAAHDDDPSQPNPFSGDEWSSNAAVGFGASLESDFEWMYDDGYGAHNGDCTSPMASGCWGHRNDILGGYSAPLVMGAAYDAKSNDSYPAMTELFVSRDSATGPGQPDAPLVPTWATITQTLPIGVSTTRLDLAGSARSAQLELWASGEAMEVKVLVTSDAGGWSVSPAGCPLHAGAKCELTVKDRSTAPGDGTLTLTGPNGPQAVALRTGGKLHPKVTASLQHSSIATGHSTKLIGRVSPSEGGKRVELQREHGQRWSNVASAVLTNASKFSFTIKGRSGGKFKYRASVPADGTITSGTSSTVTLRVS